MQPDFTYDVRALFRRTAEAVVATQQQLDRSLGREHLLASGNERQRMLFSVPRASVNLRFGVTEITGGGWKPLPWKRTPSLQQMHTHELEFTVDAVPELPTAFTNDANRSLVPLRMRIPYFMLSTEAETEIIARLLTALNPDNPSWASRVVNDKPPGGMKDLTKLIGKDAPEPEDATGEIGAIRKALGDPSSERGMVYFRLDLKPVSYLVARVVGKDANDSLFVLTPGATPEVLIYSLDGDEVHGINYHPLHQLLETIRLCQQGLLEPITTNDLNPGTVSGLQAAGINGLQPLLPFAEDIRSGYLNGLQYLSDPATESSMQIPGAQLTPSLYYDITSATASLNYSLRYTDEGDNSRPLFDFEMRRTIDDKTLNDQADGTETKLIESRALIRISREDDYSRMEVELETPEFVLSGTARERLIKLAVNSINEIEKAVPVDASLYRSFIEDQGYQAGVIALLSYRGDEPQEKFLIVWPGTHSGASRDFAFTCALSKDRAKLADVKFLMTVDQDLDNVALVKDGDLGGQASGEQYRPFHNFFHAVRIWRARMMV